MKHDVQLTVEFLDRSVAKFYISGEQGGSWFFLPMDPKDGLARELVIKPTDKGMPRTQIPLNNVRMIGVEMISAEDGD